MAQISTYNNINILITSNIYSYPLANIVHAKDIHSKKMQ